ncbi:tRNA pseudouridine(65) synthase TruC [Aeromonas simiae]|uniref:tRNA pseudouridine(65) synthase TruC n=1 Tax=Aeromonas simiae TaxID=218936 RepID=UPI0005A6C8F6|nr:tRNA pseudouridine(65) synthase TruC [Aeromonas simiae]
MTLELLYQDDWLVAVNKPSGLLVHRSWLDKHETRFAMQMTRDLIGGRHVYPVHRLDRPTSGVLLFALDPQTARTLIEAFAGRQVHKEYLALVRGWAPEQGLIDYPLKEQLDKIADAFSDQDKPAQEAVTSYRRLHQVELPYAVSKKHPTSRYSLVRLHPHTGRKHQLRRHLDHIFHPIIGDTTHGDGRHNRFFKQELGSDRLLLVSRSLSFTHPVLKVPMRIQAPLGPEVLALFERLGWPASESDY